MQDLLKLDQQLCFPIYLLSKEITALYRPLLDDLDLTYPQYLVMIVLWEHGSLHVGEIGERLHLDSGTLTPLLKRLESKQIVSRARGTSDERIVEISLTEKGQSLKEKASCIPMQLMEQINISKEEQESFKHIIQKILNSVLK